MSKRSNQDRRTSNAGRRKHSVEHIARLPGDAPQARPTPGRAQAYENAWRNNLLHWSQLPPDVQRSIRGH